MRKWKEDVLKDVNRRGIKNWKENANNRKE